MAINWQTNTRLGRSIKFWCVAISAGLIAGTGMGLFLHYQLFMFPMLGLLFGTGAVIDGILIHLIASVVFAIGFAAVLGWSPLHEALTNQERVVASGIIYGSFLWLSGFGVIMPILTRVTPPHSLPIPYLPLDALLAHVVYGFLLGVVCAYFGEQP